MPQFSEVRPDDFMKVGGDKPPHLLIEQEIITLGSQLGNGGAFKKEVLKLAGWTGGSLTTYASRAELAAEVFNRLRNAMEGTETADELKQKLSQLH